MQSLAGWGSMLNQAVIGNTGLEPIYHINLLELRVVQKLLHHFATQLRHRYTMVRSDSTTVVVVVRAEGLRSPPCTG